MAETFACVADVAALLGEGPLWVASEQALYWVDIKGRAIFRLTNDGALQRWDTPVRVGSLSRRQGGGFIAGTDHGLFAVDLDSGRFERLLDPEPDRPGNRFNDAKVDRSGRLWAGTMDDGEAQASGALYRFDALDRWARVDDDYRVTNGPAFSPDGAILYHNDSARQVTYAFDLDHRGEVSNRRVLARYSDGDGYPDGMTVDRDGHLWVAFWDGWCVRRLSPAGEVVETVPLPVARPTSCAFGGPGLGRLFVTSASIGLSAEERAAQPQAGGLFAMKAPVVGIAELPFAG